MAFKPIDPKRDEFRRYLERAGVIEALTKIFVRLVKERPENPMEYLHNNLSDVRLQADQEAFLRTELEEARAEIQRLRGIIMNLDSTALEEAKETTSSEKTQNADGASEEKIKGNCNMYPNSTGEVGGAESGNENARKCVGGNKCAEIDLELKNKHNNAHASLDQSIVIPQRKNADGLSEQLSETTFTHEEQSDDNIIEITSKLTDFKQASSIVKSEGKQTNIKIE